MGEHDNSRSLILRPDVSLAGVTSAPKRILSSMVGATLSLARASAVDTIDLDALVREGKRIQRKQGMTPEDVRAFGLFLRAAEGGHREAQYLVFICYHWGLGIPQSLPNGIEWLHKSAEAGLAEAQDMLGIFCADGKGVPKDYAEAVRWRRKAGEQGDSNAQRALGFHYASGQGVQQDYAEAVRWYRKAAEQGNACAQTNLGECYSNGQGAEIDFPRAYAWYKLAADQGYEFAQERPAALKALMSPLEFEAACQNYQEFKEKYSVKR